MRRRKLAFQQLDRPARLAADADKLSFLSEVIRYWDSFANKWQSVDESYFGPYWTVKFNGSSSRLNFSNITTPALAVLARHWASQSLQVLNPATVAGYFKGICEVERKLGSDRLTELLTAAPHQLAKDWHLLLMPMCRPSALSSLKSLLVFCCERCVGELRPYHADYVKALRFPPPTGRAYAAVRAGSVFLTLREEAAIVDYLDSVNRQIDPLGDFKDVDVEALRAACVLAISYQFAMRPIQMAAVRLSDVRLYQSGKNEPYAVHITFLKVKQRSSGKRLPMTRKIKREWCPIFARVHAIRVKNPALLSRKGSLTDSYLGLNPSQVSALIQEITSKIAGRSLSANQLRHTGAQRLVDAGATKEELAEFMGHSSYHTGLVYFDISPTQADRVNKALAISPIYSAVAEVARTRCIDKKALLKRPADQQIGGVPHGIPIAGIGACQLGQSLCQKNPVLACYTCAKFMPVRDDRIHRETIESLREIVKRFHATSRGEIQSPAFMQLRQTLSAAQELIEDLDAFEDKPSDNLHV